MKIVLWAMFTIWLVVLCILSSIPGDRFGTPPFSWADKVVHTTIFAVGSFLLASAFHATLGRSVLKTAVIIFGAMVLIGVGDELHQVYTPGRSGNDRGDLLADATGALIGILLAGLCHGKRSAKPNPPAPVADRPA